MKTMFTSGIFWGSLLILIGLSVLLKVIFGINIPVFRILFGLLLIYFGVRLITGIDFFTRKKDELVIFDQSEKMLEGEKAEYNVLFSKSVIYLNDIKTQSAEVNVIFGDAELILSDSIPVVLNVSSAFGAARFPDETTISFGERTFRSGDANSNVVKVNANVVFGNLKILVKNQEGKF